MFQNRGIFELLESDQNGENPWIGEIPLGSNTFFRHFFNSCWNIRPH